MNLVKCLKKWGIVKIPKGTARGDVARSQPDRALMLDGLPTKGNSFDANEGPLYSCSPEMFR